MHANKQALLDIELVLKEFDLSIFCGDVLGYGIEIDYCIDFILNKIDLVVIGNHDRLAITSESLENQDRLVKNSIEFTRTKLSSLQIKLIRDLPSQINFENIYISRIRLAINI